MNDVYKKLGKNTMLFTLGSFGQKILTFLFVPFYTSILSTADYGTVDLLVTIISLIWPLFTIQVDEAILRFCLDKDSDKDHILTIGAWVNIFSIIPMVVFSISILFVDTLSSYWFLFILYYIVYAANTFTSFAAKGLEKVSLFAVSGIITSAVVISFNLLFLLVFKLGIVGYLLSYIIAYFTTSIYVFWQAKLHRYIHAPSTIDRNLFKEIKNYSLPLIPNSISWWVNNSSDRLMVAYICGVASNGLLAVAYKIPSMLNTLSSMFSNAWQISAVEEFDAKDSRNTYSAIYNKYFSLNILVVAGLAIISKLIGKLLFAKEFFKAWQLSPLLLLSSMFMILSGFLGTIYTSAKQTKMVFYSTLAGAVVNIVLNWILIHYMGAQGAVVATLISQLLIWLIRTIDSKKIMPLDLNWGMYITALLLTLAEIILVLMDNIYCFGGAILLLLVVLFLMKDTVIEMLKLVKKIIFRGK